MALRLTIAFLVSLFCTVSLSFGQSEVEYDLLCNPQLAVRKHADKRGGEAGELRGGGTLTLPFFDDFSRYSLPTDDASIPQEWQRWSDTTAYINTHLPSSPPTIGVATLDGLNARGYPYNFNSEFSQGPADTLTSLPIDLSGFSAGDNIYLTFMYQRGGLGNAPEAEDSLVIDFFSPFGQGEWFHTWSVPGGGSGAFEQAFIRIDQPEYLLSGFRFRFRNYATLSGAFDHWHIDYVIIRQGIDPDNFLFDEVALQYPNYTLLQEYSAMPWTHYISNPSVFMRNNFETKQRNLGPTENIVTGYSITYEGDVDNFPEQDINPFGNAFQEISRIIPLNGYAFDPSVSDTTAVFDVKVYVNPTDLNLQNDTARFRQVFTNYYAYDDGTAERAWAVTSAGASVAMRYRAEIPDTLLGVFIHWLPHGVNVSGQIFLLRVWGESAGIPGNELIDNFIFHNPKFYDDGYNIFSYYEFDHPVPVSGNFFVGWTQPAAIGLNVGNDKNSNANPTRLFYRLGIGQNWQQSIIEGSAMIRPVFKAGMSEVWNSVEELEAARLHIYPNPAETQLHVEWPYRETGEYHVLDLTGRVVLRGMLAGEGRHTIAVDDLRSGAYILAVQSRESGVLTRQTFIRR